MIDRAGARHSKRGIGGFEGKRRASHSKCVIPWRRRHLYWHHGIASMEGESWKRGEPIPKEAPRCSSARRCWTQESGCCTSSRRTWSSGRCTQSGLIARRRSCPCSSSWSSHRSSRRICCRGRCCGRGAVLCVGRLAGVCLRVDHRHLDVDHPLFAARERLVLPRSGARGGRRVLFSVPLRQLVLGHDRAGVPARAAAGDHRVHHPRRQARRRGRCARAGRGDAGAASAGGGCSGVRHRLQRDRVLGGARERRAVVGA